MNSEPQEPKSEIILEISDCISRTAQPLIEGSGSRCFDQLLQDPQHLLVPGSRQLFQMKMLSHAVVSSALKVAERRQIS